MSEKLKVAVFDWDYLPYLRRKDGIEYLSFSVENSRADYFLSEGKIWEKGVLGFSFSLPFAETHLLHNLLAAVVVARKMGLSFEEIGAGVAHLDLPKMRFERVEKKGILFINDAYNANPDSMKLAISQLPMPKKGGKRIAVLGSMKELGSFSDEQHRKIGLFAKEVIDSLLVLGEETLVTLEAFATSNKPCRFCHSHQEMAKELQEIASPGDVVLLKGSRSMKMETVLDIF